MSNLTPTPKAKTSEAISSAAGPITFRNRTLALFAIPSFAVVLLSNLSRLGGSLIQWFLIGCIAYAVTIAVLLVFRATILPATERAPKPWLTIIAFLVAGSIRGLAVWLVGLNWGIIPESDLLFRVSSGFLLVMGGMSTLAIYEASRIKQDDQLSALNMQRTRLDELRGGIRERIRISQQELLAKVRAILEPIVAQLRSDLQSSDSQSAVNTIQNAVDQLIRPLSREMGSSGSDFEQTVVADARAVSASKLKSTWPKRVQASSMMVPALSVFATLTTAPGPLSLYVASSAFFAFVMVMLLVTITFEFFRAVTTRLWLPVWLALLVALVPALLVPLMCKALLDGLGWITPAASWLQFGLVLSLTVGLSFLMQVVRTQRASHELQLKAVIRDLSLLNSQLRQEVWFNRRRTAAVLHGPVQAALYSSAMRIKPNSTLQPEMVSLIESDIATALAKLDGSNLVEPFQEVLQQIKDVWEGIAEVSIERVSPEVQQVLDTNPTAASCALEIIREAVSNAIKHGDASRIHIAVEQSSSAFIDVKVSNDGRALIAGSPKGYGSEILDEVAFEWSINNVENRVVLTALVAIQK